MFHKVFSKATLATVPLFASFAMKPTYLDSENKTDYSNIVILPGSASSILTENICHHLGIKPGLIETKMFLDGEVFPKIMQPIRGRHVFIVQSCASPVNENIIELLLTITAARRSDPSSVTVVIPYFGYKYNRRGLPISTTYQSRFLWSAAGDLAKMLQAVGVDNVISVDLQRPGQGHEACFFDSSIPVETISANDSLVSYFSKNCDLKSPVVVVSPNTECVKKARKFQKKLKASTKLEKVENALFMHDPNRTDSKASSEFLGNVQDADVIIVDDIVDTARSLSILCHRLRKEGARRVFICASHGLFSQEAMQLIDMSPVERVVVTDTVAMPKNASAKIVQVSIAPLLARVIETEAGMLNGKYDSEVLEEER